VSQLAVAPNRLADQLRARQFTYMAELVASATKPEADVLEMAARIGAVPQIAAIGVTSYAGGATGHDPVRIAAGLQRLGLTPNVHITCVSRDRRALGEVLRDLEAQELHNIFAISGDWPKGDGANPAFDVDSVQLVAAIAELRQRHATPFHVSVAVSPFKYQREDCLYQYLKLEKKVAAGADMAITQVGWDARKFRELKRYVDEHGLATPLLGNVYVLGAKAAERMATGNPPGCWASPELVAATAREAAAPDKGLAARLERAAITVAILKGLGYAGAYIGGTHDPGHLARIIGRGEELAPRWEELLDDLQFGRAGGFYLYDAPAPPKPTRTFLPIVLDMVGESLPVPWTKRIGDTALRRSLEAFFRWVDRRPLLSHWFERFEYYSKHETFDCRNCGNCVLGSMEYVCPQTCPKQMRNGPCGGTNHGWCEVIPSQPCIWVKVMERAEAADEVRGLLTYIPPPDRSLFGTASWINYYLGRDSRPGLPKAGINSDPPVAERAATVPPGVDARRMP
jgi:methylenetetrahydrofolate reductase (NADPH)